MNKKNPPSLPSLPNSLLSGVQMAPKPPARPATRQMLSEAGSGFAREEGRLREAVRDHRREALPTLPGPYSDAGPKGFARGPLEAVEVETVSHDPKTGAVKVETGRAVRRKGPDALACMPPAFQQAAREYAGLVEMVASVRAPGDGPRTGLGDGGAAARCEWSLKLRACEDAIGRELVLAARGVHAHADRGRRSVRCLDLVNAVVLDGLSVSGVLARFGWPRGRVNDLRVRSDLTVALKRLAAHMGLVEEAS